VRRTAPRNPSKGVERSGAEGGSGTDARWIAHPDRARPQRSHEIMDADTLLPSLLVLAGLFIANAFFVAAEFTLIGVRRSRLEQMAREGDRRAQDTLPTLDRPEPLALAAQFGGSVSALLTGFVAARLGLSLISPLIGDTGSATFLVWQWAVQPVLAVGVAIALVAVLHVILCEQIPKILGIQRAEWIATRVTIAPLRYVALILYPLVWVISRLVTLAMRVLKLERSGSHPLVHTPEEIRLLVAQSHEQGVVEEDEREMIHGVFEFSDTVAREVMTPRTDVVAVPIDATLDELIRVAVEEGHSRLPVFDGTIDSIAGVVLTRDLLPLVWARSHAEASEPAFDIRSLMREPYFIPDTKPVDDLLAEFRQNGVHLAIVLDEFGGTYGLVTMEDLLEEIVGEIHDEYDVAEVMYEETPEGDALIDGSAPISEVNERWELELPDSDYDTLGGFIFGALGRVPEQGDWLGIPAAAPRVWLIVEEIEDRRVARVRLSRDEPDDGAASESDAAAAEIRSAPEA
jgi:CBS domain containing-hemolysin-like protein